MTKSPAFQLYVNDFLGSAKVGMMSTEEIGAYVLLLFLDWQEGGFVYDPKGLAKWCRLSPAAFRRTWERVGQCFIEKDGRLWNPRLAIEREKQAAWKEKAAKGAATTNEKRWGKDRPSDEIAVANESLGGRTPLPSPLPSPVTDEKTPPAARVVGVSEAALEAQCGDQWPAIKRFLDERPSALRDDWATDLLRLIGPATGNLPEDLARACTDGALADPPVTNARTLRIFTARCREERVRGVLPAISRAPQTVRLSKQEIGRQNLADAIARREREATVNGE